MLRQADVAMYHAKRSGAGRYERFEPRHARGAHRAPLLAHRAATRDRPRGIRAALPTDRRPALGPDPQSRAWSAGGTPTADSSAPLDFIPLAEQTGMVGEMGRWVLERAAGSSRSGGAGADRGQRQRINA